METGYSVPVVRRAAFARVLRKKCPQCGAGRLFARYARLAVSCTECGLTFRREQGAQTGSMYLTAAITEIVAALFVGLAWIFTDWSTPVFLGVSVPLILVFSAWFLPVSQAFWVGVEYATDASNGEPWVRPVP